jgi:exodeoxyribonuclease-3
MLCVSWNVNGIRSVSRKGFHEWLLKRSPDILCVQETKAQPDQLTGDILSPEPYRSYWHSAKKKGYSGVVTFSRLEPLHVHYGLGQDMFDDEGRVLTLEFDTYAVINAYFPNSQRHGARLEYKLAFCKAIHAWCQSWIERGKHMILCGDYNIAHCEIDLKNPKSNKKNAGFLPEERAWMSHFLSSGIVDIFRDRHPEEPDHYTWWSYRPGIRERNVGWRIDYHCIDTSLASNISEAGHWPEDMGSDHCPVYLNVQVEDRKP